LACDTHLTCTRHTQVFAQLASSSRTSSPAGRRPARQLVASWIVFGIPRADDGDEPPALFSVSAILIDDSPFTDAEGTTFLSLFGLTALQSRMPLQFTLTLFGPAFSSPTFSVPTFSASPRAALPLATEAGGRQCKEKEGPSHPLLMMSVSITSQNSNWLVSGFD